MTFDLDDYLQRIRMPARPTLDASGLQRLQHAHRLAIPFENLDIWLGRAIAIDSDAVFAKLVRASRGGYCFEHNRLFLDALAALGFAAEPILARVWLGATEVPPLTHTLARLHLEGRDWIVDAGFGGSYTPPMPLIDGAEAAAPDGARFRLRRDETGWMLLRHGDPALTDGRGAGTGWQPQYGFTGEIAPAADLALGNHWSCTAPGSRFTRHRLVSIILPHGFATLTDRTYRRKAGDTATEDTITDPRVYRMRLSMMFGIDLSADQVARVFPAN